MWRLRVNPLRGFILPQRCIICDAESDWLICQKCLSELKPYSGFRCKICSKPLATDNSVCPLCLNPARKYERGFSLFDYSDNRIRLIIEQIKFHGKPSLANFLFNYQDMIKKLDIFENADKLVPVPMYRKDLIERGYNQSVMLAKTLKRITGIPVAYTMLEKRKQTQKQVGLGYVDRIKNLKGAFQAHHAKGVKCVVLVDDVFTTGSTINECAWELSKYGITSRFFTVATTSAKDI